MYATGHLTISMCKLQLTQMVPSECVSVGAVMHCLFHRYFLWFEALGIKHVSEN